MEENANAIKSTNPADLVTDFTQSQSPKQNIDQKNYPDIKELKYGEIRVLDTYENLRWLLRHFGASVRYNLMSRQREIDFPWMQIPTEDRENASLYLITHIATVNGMPIKSIDNHLDMIALQNQYHPIVDALKANPWDGKKRLQFFLQTIKAENQPLAEQLLTTWMVCAVAAAHSVTGFINNGVLVLQGKQNIGKTSWIRKLDPIGCKAVKESSFLDPTNKDSIAQIASYWIAELGELDSIFQKSAIGRLKSYITMEYDYVRLPYAKRPVFLPRRTAYIATVNEDTYLVDQTGNRRWWTISVESIDLEHGLDMMQIWAEVYALWQAGALTYLSKDLQEQVNCSNKQYEKTDPMKEKLLAYYNWDDSERVYKTATKVLEEIGYPKPTQGEATRMGNILTELNGDKSKLSNGKKVHKVPRFII